MKHYKVVNAKRFIIACLVMISIFTGLISMIINAIIPEEKIIADEEIYYIQEGETLWSICSNHCPSDMDIRNYIHDVEDYNGMDSANLQIGQEVRVPIYE